MLDIMRKHTQSWLIKVIFALIILTFVFFFGYSRVRKGQQGTGIAARVGNATIPYGAYKMALENARENYKRIFPDGIPENMTNQLKQSALQQIINSVIFAQLGKKLGLTVTNDELYDAVSNNPQFKKDGAFDPDIYKNTILPYFERRYSINYEYLLKNELLTVKTIDFLTGNLKITESEARSEYDREKTTWTFDRITVPNRITEEDKEIDGNEVAGEVLTLLTDGPNWRLKNLVKKHDLKREVVGPISIDAKHRLISPLTDNEVFAEIFSLTQENPIVSRPISAGTKLHILKLTSHKKPTEEEWLKEKEEFSSRLLERKKQAHLAQWQSWMREKTKIEEYVLSKK